MKLLATPTPVVPIEEVVAPPRHRVLFVDDDASLLEAVRRSVRGDFQVDVVPGPDAALEALRAHGGYRVLISDYRMARMDGLQLMEHARRISPLTCRMLFTGLADLDTAVRAINEGQIFRLLRKPCRPDVVSAAIREAIAQFEVLEEQHELLDRTFRASLDTLVEMMAMTSPLAHARALRVRETVREFCQWRGMAAPAYLEQASVLSQLGLATLPMPTVERVYLGQPATAEERVLLDEIPNRLRRLLTHIPRIDKVLEALLFQDRDFTPPDLHAPGPWGLEIPEGARLLRIVVAHDVCLSKGLSMRDASRELHRRRDQFDPTLLDEFNTFQGEQEASRRIRHIALSELQVGMTLAEDVIGGQGVLLIGRGQKVTLRALSLVRSYYEADTHSVRLQVMNPDDESNKLGSAEAEVHCAA